MYVCAHVHTHVCLIIDILCINSLVLLQSIPLQTSPKDKNSSGSVIYCKLKHKTKQYIEISLWSRIYIDLTLFLKSISSSYSIGVTLKMIPLQSAAPKTRMEVINQAAIQQCFLLSSQQPLLTLMNNRVHFKLGCTCM